jgi:hypothetical protein
MKTTRSPGIKPDTGRAIRQYKTATKRTRKLKVSEPPASLTNKRIK